MKIRPKAENPLEWIALKLNLVPTPLVETQVAFNAARAIMAAAELGMFEVIGKDSKNAEEIAGMCRTHLRGTQHLLDCLVGIGYLKWDSGNYSIKPKYYKWLLKAYESNVIDKLRFQRVEWNWMSKLEDYVRTGNPIRMHDAVSENDWELYQRGMRDLSVNAATELARKIPVPKGAKKILDIGGSHGLFSIELCKKYPGLTSNILELPEAIESARSIAEKYDQTGRVRYLAGNALMDDLGQEQYDIVMINNLAHHFTADQNKALAAKVAHTLKTGGLYAIGEFIHTEKPGEGGLIASTTDLYFALTSSSGTWPASEIQAWQKNAGLNPERTIKVMSMPGWKVLIAKKY